MGLHNCPVFAVSEWCNDESNARSSLKWALGIFWSPLLDFAIYGTSFLLLRPVHRQRELEQVEQADTDRLTNLANRRRMDEFLDALVTLYPEERQPSR